MNGSTQTTSAQKATLLLDQATARIESKSIKEWATSEQNRAIWLQIAQKAIENGKSPDVETDVIRFSTYMVSAAIGL